VNIRTFTTPLRKRAVDALIVSAFEGAELPAPTATINTALNGAISDLLETGDFTGKTAQVAVTYPRGTIPAKRVIVVGLGKRDALTPDILRRAAAAVAATLREIRAVRAASMLHGAPEVGVETAAEALAEGTVLGLYTYHGQKTGEQQTARLETLEVAGDSAATRAGLEAGRQIALATRLTRDLANLPPNICTPTYLAETAQRIGKEGGMRVEVLDQSQMEALKMGALLAVTRGSDTEPRFIIMEHNARHPRLDTIVLVGKGITFDTGGYSIKPADGMVGMKGDMSGAAAVIGAMQAIAALKVPLHVVGLVPACENMINGHAYLPQEVITASNGVTIEVISTDAEGRLILADALVYADRYKPAAVVDIATLTGSIAVALGNQAAGLFCTDDTLRDRLVAAGAHTAERVWPMPLYPEYEKALESKTADIKNSGGRFGGACLGAIFLRKFTSYPAWAHVDMAGVMTDVPENPYIPGGGASGFGTRLLVEFVRRWAGPQ
jgi:leucyl aminopeptidase